MGLDYEKIIRSHWNSEAKEYSTSHLEHLDCSMHPSWGLWHVKETEIKIFTTPLSQKKVVDLGCGRGHDAVAYAKMGARVVAVDISEKQLENAIAHPCVQYLVGSAEKLPLVDMSIDIAISDHGAFDHSPASGLLKEMKRILKPEGQLIICTYSPLSYSCFDANIGRIGNTLINTYPYADLRTDGNKVNAQYSYGAWIKLFNAHNFDVKRLEEIVVPPDAPDYFNELVDASWASKWPCDIIWSVQKRD